MDKDEQLIAIAEACGRVRRMDGHWFPHGSRVGSQGIPNFCKDLNAMHEVEEMLTEDQRKKYWSELYEFAPRRVFSTHKDNWQMIHPTARQRAESFLRTLGKWEEVKP